MPLNGPQMAAEVIAAIKTVTPLTPAQEADALTNWTPICTAIVTHFTVNGTVPALGLLDSTSNPVTGAAKIV